MNGIKQVGIVLVVVLLQFLPLFRIVKLIAVGIYMDWVVGVGFVSSRKEVDLHASFLLTFPALMLQRRVLPGDNSFNIFETQEFLAIPVIYSSIIF